MRKILACLLAFYATPALAQTVPVSFVGCPADGQTGPEAAPDAAPGGGFTPLLPPAQAQKLSFYSSSNLGVLAPRGWHCAGAYGASGAFLVVTQQPITPADLLRTFKITGPAVQFSVSDGATSGRFEVARMAARLFPAASGFVARVKAENLEPASDFAPTPYTGDQITRHGDYLVTFVTPPNQQGLGTAFRLVPSPLAIHGFALLQGDESDFSLVTLDVRLPAGFGKLVDIISIETLPQPTGMIR